MTSREAAITLNLIPGLGSIRVQRLMEFFGCPEIILHAGIRDLMQVKGIGHELARSISLWKTITNAEKEMELARQAGVRITTLFEKDYPESLRTIHDPPIVLYSRGTWLPDDSNRSVAIVGSRMATHYGRLATKKFAYELAESGVTIISGLAKGIDTEAHQAAITAHGRTVAIIGCGLNHCYPMENRPLIDTIANGYGAVVSEFPMSLPPSKATFPMRNRIISAWAKATLVIEAPTRSGSLITAQQAIDQGRYVFAVPGPIDRPQSDGCHELIRDGATLVSSPRQIMEDLGWHSTAIQTEMFDSFLVAETPACYLSDEEELVITNIDKGLGNIDALCSGTAMPAWQLTPILAKLQIKRRIASLPGGEFKVVR